MTNKISIAGIMISLFIFTTFAFVFVANNLEGAESRDRGGESTRRSTTTPAPTPTPPMPPTPPSNSSSGGITSSTSITLDTGGNEGGTVVTGDEHGEVFEVNIGPTNNTPDDETNNGEEEVAEEPPAGSEEQCNRRTGECVEEAPDRASR